MPATRSSTPSKWMGLAHVYSGMGCPRLAEYCGLMEQEARSMNVDPNDHFEQMTSSGRFEEFCVRMEHGGHSVDMDHDDCFERLHHEPNLSESVVNDVQPRKHIEAATTPKLLLTQRLQVNFLFLSCEFGKHGSLLVHPKRSS